MLNQMEGVLVEVVSFGNVRVDGSVLSPSAWVSARCQMQNYGHFFMVFDLHGKEASGR